MATIAIGDIHGHLNALNDLLKQLRLEIAAGDTVVFLGDDIDRGPFSKECIDCILDYVRTRTLTREGENASYQARFAYNADRYGATIDHLFVDGNFNPEVGYLQRRDFRRTGCDAQSTRRDTHSVAAKTFPPSVRASPCRSA